MPKIRWTNLPPSLRQHLFDRVAERRIHAEDLYKLKLWRESEPEAPDGPWYKDFGSFKICGEGEFPKTFLLRDSRQRGRPCNQHEPELPRHRDHGDIDVGEDVGRRAADDHGARDQDEERDHHEGIRALQRDLTIHMPSSTPRVAVRFQAVAFLRKSEQ